jgi:type IV secretion system protein TrbI
MKKLKLSVETGQVHNQVGQEITKRNASIQPTLTIRPGFSMRVMVSKDLVLRPYQPLFFVRGVPQ